MPTCAVPRCIGPCSIPTRSDSPTSSVPPAWILPDVARRLDDWLVVVPAGARPANPGALLGSKQVKTLLSRGARAGGGRAVRLRRPSWRCRTICTWPRWSMG